MDDPPAAEESSCRAELIVMGTAVGRRVSKGGGDTRPVSAVNLSLFDWPQPGLESLLEGSGLRVREDDEEGSCEGGNEYAVSGEVESVPFIFLAGSKLDLRVCCIGWWV